MSKLNIDQKSLNGLFSDKKSDFLIPDYQRPYAWTEDECATLWDDIFCFAFPDNDYTQFDSENDEYFLGPIVTFKNKSNGKQEVIDGQQRLTTTMLLMRAFYSKFAYMQDENSKKTREQLAKCIWKTDEFGSPCMDRLKIDSEVASDEDKDEFLEILRTGVAKADMRSRYAANYRFFEGKIDEFISSYPSYTAYLPTRIMNNVILLPIEAESQKTALRIFSTLNDRGMPLSDADIFKSQFYQYYSERNEKDEFIRRWKDLEELCGSIFDTKRGTPMDELFTRYMYYERAKQRISNTTTEALRDFYEKDSYALLNRSDTFDSLEALADFWDGVYRQDDERFSDRVLKRFFVLNYAPNGMWTYMVSVYFLRYRDENGLVEEEPFYEFLSRITGFIWAYALARPGVNALRSPVYPELINIIDGKPVTFDRYRFDRDEVAGLLTNFKFTNNRRFTRSMLTWWAFEDEEQRLLDLDSKLDIEHIYAKNRAKLEHTLAEEASLEALGNKSLLEKRINIRASDYQFAARKKFYMGNAVIKGQQKEGTRIHDLIALADSHEDFTETDIHNRTKQIITAFLDYLERMQLVH